MQYFSGIVAESQYRVGKGDLAIDTAFSALDEIEFPRFLNNAVVYLGTAAVDEGDAAYCEQILSRLEQEYAQVELYPGLAEFETMLRDFIDGPTE